MAALPPLDTETIDRQKFVIHGLKENDPDINVYVVKPKETKKKRLPVLFGFGEGSTINNRYETLAATFDSLAVMWDCAMVFVEARSAIHCYYPEPLDDYQAGYEWLLENGRDLGLNTKNIVLYGESGGGFTVLAFAFRCKRLGFTPKGCMACEPIVSDTMAYPSSKIVSGGCWDSLDVLRMFKMNIHPADQFSPFVGPEVVPGHATVEDCKGLCPMYLHGLEMDSDRDPMIAFAEKLYEAKVFTQIHVWGGVAHGGLLLAPADAPLRRAYDAVRAAEIADMFNHDFRRPWTVEE